MKGKVRYMPPEQMLAYPPIDRRADIFAVGVMMWESLTGVRLWKDKSDVHIINAVVNDGVPSPKSVNPDVPDELNEICVKALERNRDDRFETAGDMELAINRAMQKLELRATPRDIAKFTCDVFASSRAETKKIIEKQLTSLGDLRPVSLDDGAEEIDLAIPDAPSIDLADSRVNFESSQLSTVKPRQARGKRAALVIAGCSILILAVGTIWATTGRPTASAQSAFASSPPVDSVSASLTLPVSTSLTPPVSASPSTTLKVHIHIDTDPPDAVLAIDGEQVANPFDRDVAPDSSSHAVTASWGAIKTTPMPVRFPDRANITIEKPKPQQPPSPWPVVSGVRATTKATSTPHCNNPFYVDSAGIRHVRPECL